MKSVKILAAIFFTFCFSVIQFAGVAFAAGEDASDASSPDASIGAGVGGTVLPETKKKIVECTDIMNEVSKNSCLAVKVIFKKDSSKTDKCTGVTPKLDGITENDVLGCGIKTGTIKLWMVPYYIRYILQFIIGISGLVAVGGIVYGGYLYLFAGVSSEKDQGKKAIQYGLIGMVMTLIAWAFVNIIISLVTG